MAFPPARRPSSVPRKSLVTGPRHSGTCRAQLCTRLVHSAGPSWCRWPWERSRGPRAAPAGNWGSPASGWWRGSSRRPRAPTSRVRGGVAGGNLQSVGRQLVKGVVLVHQTCSPTSVKSCPEPLSPFLSYILAGSPLGSLFVTHSAQDMGLSTWFLVGDLVPYF